MQKSNRSLKYALLSIASNSTLIAFKVIAGLLSGSVSIISEAIHSGMDLAASIVAFISVRESAKPADKEHPYGHGKVENISGLVEGVLIFIAAGLIIKEAYKKLFEPADIEQAWGAILVMFAAAMVNLLVSRTLYKVSKEEDSMALEADALHLKTDVYTSLGVGLGILLIKLTGINILDPVVAIIVACLIIKEAWELTSSALNFVLDARLSDQDEDEIKKIIESHSNQYIDYHKLKTRKSGNKKHIDFHLTMNPDLTVRETHELIGIIKKEMNDKFGYTRVVIHVDPFENDENNNN
ncbi:MAG: cation diffusion facilitator family transporter [Solirubrobacterales bacterium]